MNMRFKTRGLILLAALLCVQGSPVVMAEENSPEALCRQRNMASCEINGLRFFIEDDCPRGAKTLRPKGNERCDLLVEEKKAQQVQAAKAAVETDAKPVLPETRPESHRQEAAGGWFDNPFFVVAVIGLLQGLISRAAWGPFIIVAVVLPVVVTWGAVTGADVPGEGWGDWMGIGTVFVKIEGCSLLGWGAGLAAHVAMLRMMSK